MPLTPEELDDLVELSIPLFKQYKWTDISLEFPEYIASRILTEKYVTERGGTEIKFKLKHRNTGLARNTGIMSEDVTGVEDVAVGAAVPWTKQTVNWSYSIDEDEFQSDPETIVDELKMREHDAMSDMAELNEENMWSSPTGATDKRPMGIPFWLQKDGTTSATEGSMNGGNPSGWSTGRAGLSSSTYARWKNWTFRYTNVSRDDLIRKIKLSMFNTNFRAPVKHPELGYGSKPQREIYTTFRVSEPLERISEDRNQNHGSELARFAYADGSSGVTVGGVPVIPVHYLENNDTNDPLYGVDWGVFRPFVRKNGNMRRMGPMQAPKQHDMKTVHYDTFMNYSCYNLRRCWVGSEATT